jgi:hypothetical protein
MDCRRKHAGRQVHRGLTLGRHLTKDGAWVRVGPEGRFTFISGLFVTLVSPRGVELMAPYEKLNPPSFNRFD